MMLEIECLKHWKYTHYQVPCEFFPSIILETI